jgi:hypothetical protein
MVRYGPVACAIVPEHDQFFLFPTSPCQTEYMDLYPLNLDVITSDCSITERGSKCTFYDC